MCPCRTSRTKWHVAVGWASLTRWVTGKCLRLGSLGHDCACQSDACVPIAPNRLSCMLRPSLSRHFQAVLTGAFGEAVHPCCRHRSAMAGGRHKGRCSATGLANTRRSNRACLLRHRLSLGPIGCLAAPIPGRPKTGDRLKPRAWICSGLSDIVASGLVLSALTCPPPSVFPASSVLSLQASPTRWVRGTGEKGG